MSLDNFSDNISGSARKAEPSAFDLFKDSALYELNRSAIGLAQAVGMDGHFNQVVEPKSSDTSLVRLPDLNVWRFSQYVGLTPAERLGLDTKEEVEAHLHRVEQLRESNAIRSALH